MSGFIRPNWEIPDEYSFINYATLSEIAWEFMRRHPDYERDQMTLEYYTQNGLLFNDPENNEYGDAWEFIDYYTNKYACNVSVTVPKPSENRTPDFFSTVGPIQIAGQYSGSIVTAGMVKSKLMMKLNTSLPEAPQFIVAEQIFNSAVEKQKSQPNDGELKHHFNTSVRQSQIVLPVNLSLPWETQRPKLKTDFRAHQKEQKYQSAYGIGKQSFEKYPLYLRILDALHANVSNTEIAKYIYGEEGKMSDELRSRMLRNKNAAIRLRDYGFRQIPHMTSSEQYQKKKVQNLNYQSKIV